MLIVEKLINQIREDKGGVFIITRIENGFVKIIIINNANDDYQETSTSIFDANTCEVLSDFVTTYIRNLSYLVLNRVTKMYCYENSSELFLSENFKISDYE